jgi:hypothetical protein
MRGFGESFFVDSQRGKAMKQMKPRTIIAMMLPFPHPPDALVAIVRGTRIKANAALSSMIPPRSSSKNRSLITRRGPRPFHGPGEVRPSRLAFRPLMNKVSASGKNIAGSMIVHIPYPHLQVVVFKIAFPMIEPIHTVIKNGISGKLDHRARLSRSLVSAINICCRIWSPVEPAE